MRAGRPRQVDPGSLYVFAHQFYWDFRRLAEGGSRQRFNEPRYKHLVNFAESAIIELNAEQKARAQEVADEEIRSGKLNAAERESRVVDIEQSQEFATRAGLLMQAAQESMEPKRVPGEADVIRTLLNPHTTPTQVRKLCKDAFTTRSFPVAPGVTKDVPVSNWPISVGSMLPIYLAQHAEEYCAALKDGRFPKCDISLRPSNGLKQLWFMSRALAGAVFGVKTRTAINLVGSKRPEEVFEDSRNSKPARRQKKLKKQ